MARKFQFPPSVNPGIPKEQKIPEGWKLAPFGEVLRVVERPAKLQDEDEYQLVTAKRNREGIIPREKLLGKKILTKNQYYLRSGDFLISRRQIIHGACGIVPESLDGAIVSNEYSTLLPTNDLLLEYLSYYSHTTHFQQTCFHSSIGVDVEKMVFKIDDWLHHKIPFPPISEQEQICSILGSVDDAIKATQTVIDQIQRVKKGMLQQLVTRGIGHTQFKQTEIGGIPKDWKVVTIGEVITLQRGHDLPLNERVEGDIPVIGSNGIVGYHNETRAKGPGVSMGRSGTIGKIYYCESDYWPLNTSLYVKDFKNNNPKFIYYLLQNLNYEKFNAGTSVPTLNRNLVHPHKVPFPKDNEEQQKIAAILSMMDDSIQATQSLLDQNLKVKQNLMQDLLTGRVRVKLNEEVTV